MQRKQDIHYKRAYSISEAAEYACVSESTVRNWIHSGLIPYEVLPGRGKGSRRHRLIRLGDLNEFLNNHYYIPKNNNNKKISGGMSLLPKGSILN